MPSKYLFLSSAQRSGYKWNNLPTISQSTRECYLTVINCKIILSSGSVAHDSVNVKMKIPSLNYFSSDNQDVSVAFLNEGQTKIFTIEHENEISILTNDNLKTVEFALEDNDGDAIDADDVESFEVMIKLDYIDQDAMVNQVLLEYPKRL
jgi:hypothetical protein